MNICSQKTARAERHCAAVGCDAGQLFKKKNPKRSLMTKNALGA
jgi:hypothetical protein